MRDTQLIRDRIVDELRKYDDNLDHAEIPESKSLAICRKSMQQLYWERTSC